MFFQFILVQLVHCLPCVLENGLKFLLMDLDQCFFLYLGQDWVKSKETVFNEK